MRYLLLVSVLRDGCCPVLIHGWRYSIISAMDVPLETLRVLFINVIRD